MRLGAKLTALGFALLAFMRAATALAEGASLDEATKDQTLAAQKTFEAADVLYDSKHYAEALTAYRTSYNVVKSPNARLMIARSLRELGRLGEAYAEVTAAVADAEAAAQKHPRYTETARAARDDLAALKPRVGFVKLELGSKAKSGVTVKIGERSFDAPEANDAVAVTPGTTTIVVSAPGEVDVRREVRVAAGSTQTVSFDAEASSSLDRGEKSDERLAEEPAEPAPKTVELGPDTSLRTWAYVAGGVGAAGLLTFGVFGILNNSRYSELDGDCPNGACPPGRNDDIEAGRRYQLIANVGLGVGIVGLGAGATLFVLSANKGPAREASQTALRVGPASVSLEGRF